MNPSNPSRRRFLQTTLGVGAWGALGFPTIVPARVLGASAPSNLIQVAQIGCGRIARSSELPGILRHADVARIVAVCDLDSVRLADGRETVEQRYARDSGTPSAPVRTFADYRELLRDPAIDAVAISTPDHWHAQPAVEAMLAGKDVYLQKPASLTLAEGRQVADVSARTGRILQIGSQQRSESQFRRACELVRNGRIGKIQRIEVGLPVDPSGEVEPETAPPANLDYDFWLGSTPLAPYTEKRVHPQSDDPRKRYDRPGWLRLEAYGAGMITGWGAHHVDIAHWALGIDRTGGPVEVRATAEFPKRGLWDVHGPFRVEAKYADGALMVVSDSLPNGVKFIGEEGWIWVTRTGGKGTKALDASDPRLLDASTPTGPVKLHVSPKNDHHLDWLTSIRSREEPAAPAEAGHRSNSACIIAHLAMKTGRVLKWNPAAERFLGDDAADALLRRPQRAPYGTNAVKGA